MRPSKRLTPPTDEPELHFNLMRPSKRLTPPTDEPELHL
jgi:hypothetical protein